MREAVDGVGSLGVTCTSGTAYSVGLGNGNQGRGPTQRRMTQGQDTITYGFYQDPARSRPWGDTPGTSQIGMGTGSTQQLPIYGRVPPQRTPRPGVYRDRWW